MLLRILHRTRYRYHGAIDMAQHMVHLRPVDTTHQHVLEHELRIDPEPAARGETTDVFGNQRTFFSLQSTHSVLTVEADSLVETQAPLPLPEGPPWRAMSWERVREHFRYRAQAPFDAARALMERIHGELSYETDSTEVNTPALEALEQGKGVCQDFAHIMLGCLRTLGLPARYVSGYLLTRPPPGKPRLIGADASHAWVSVYVPLPVDGDEPAQDAAAAGAWFDFDPTNNRCGWGSPGEDYVTLATGRDFADVSPMRGVIQSGARHTLAVAVTVAPPDELGQLEALEDV
jgi:transglutaminase-like putative cysteine protease